MKQSKLDQKDMEQTSQNWYSVFVPRDLNQVSLDELFLILCHLWTPIWEWFWVLKTAPKPTPTYANPTWTAPERRHGNKNTTNKETIKLDIKVKKKTEMKIAPIQNVADIYIFWWEKLQGLKHLTFGANFNQSPSAWESKLIIGRLHWKTSPVRCPIWFQCLRIFVGMYCIVFVGSSLVFAGVRSIQKVLCIQHCLNASSTWVTPNMVISRDF